MTARSETTNEIGRRYGRALYELAKDAKAVEAVRNDLLMLKAAITEHEGLQTALKSPLYSAKKKADVLMAVAKSAKAHDITVKALGLMAENSRADHITAMIVAFDHLATADAKVVHAEVTSATPLPDKHSTAVKSALKTVLGTEPELTMTVDPEILGGLRVRVGSRLMDASLKTQLDQLSHMMKRA